MMHHQARTSLPTSQGVLNGGGGGGGGASRDSIGGGNNATNANGINDTLAQTLNLQRRTNGDDTSFRSKQSHFGTKLISPIPTTQAQPQPAPKVSEQHQQTQQQQQEPSSSSTSSSTPSYFRNKIRPTRRDRKDREPSESPPTTPPPTTSKSPTEDVVILESFGPKQTPTKSTQSSGSDKKVEPSSVESKVASRATSVSNINEVRKQLDISASGLPKPPIKQHAPSKSISAVRQSTSSGPSTPHTTSNNTSIKTSTKPGSIHQLPKLASSSKKPELVTQTPAKVQPQQQLTSTYNGENQNTPKTPNKSPTMAPQQSGPKTSASKGWLEPDDGIFSWETYLQYKPAEVAPKEAFCQANPPPVNKFQVKMKLEAVDPRNTSSWCLATVINIFGLRLQLRLDGCDTTNDFYELIDSANIRPVGSNPKEGLLPPLAFGSISERYNSFVEKKLAEVDAIIAQPDLFPPTPPKPKHNMFKVGMKLEAVDRKSRLWICPATIGSVDGSMVRVSFDGWHGSYDYTCEYFSRDLFPINWCKQTNHFIQLPKDWRNILEKGNSAEVTSSSTKSATKTPKPVEKISPPPGSTPSKKKGRPKKITPVKNDPPSPTPSSETEEDKEEFKHLTDDERYTCQRAKPIQEWRRRGKEKERKQMPREDADSDSNNSSFSQSQPVKRVRLDKPIKNATVDDILQILKSDDTLAKYSQVFIDNEIDGKAFILLTKEMMIQHMGLKIGPVLKISEIIERVKRENRI